MNKNILFFIFLTCPFLLFSQEILILDSLFRTPIENVHLISKEIGVSTNKKGVVDISNFKNSDLIEISHLSYNSKLLIKSELRNTILLKSKMKILETVEFIDEKKSVIGWEIIGGKKLTAKNIVSKSTAELLTNNSGITLQESQPGGGSPNFRGMEANRLLLVVDGVTLNNAIYRSGHLQNSSSINPFFVKNINILSGPASVAYGNGALGGALHFNTISNNQKENNIIVHQQYETSSNGYIFNCLLNYSNETISNTSGFSLKSFGNLKMGKNRLHNYTKWGNEPFIINNNRQLYTDFEQIDLMHKTIFNINNKNSLLLNYQYSTTLNVYRFDKMNDSNAFGEPKYDEWYYGPQKRFFHTISWKNIAPKKLYDEFKITLGYQKLGESRHHKKVEETLISNRYENVNVYDFLMDFDKKLYKISLLYGVGIRYQDVHSNADLSNAKNEKFYNQTRYPNGGSIVNNYFAYSQIKIPLASKLNLLLGGRVNKNQLTANFDNNSFIFSQIRNSNRSIIKSLLLDWKINNYTKIKASYYGGFRNPNIDDIGKVFSKNDRDVVVPNKNLQPEYSDNAELILNFQYPTLEIQMQVFNTKLNNAISRVYSKLDGLDSIVYDNELMRVQMNKNIESANIQGFSLFIKNNLLDRLNIISNFNYLKGKGSTESPIAHIPPFNASVTINYIYKKNTLNFYTKYNAHKKIEEYDIAGIDNLDEATLNGNPMWYTFNLYYSYKINESLNFAFCIENILDIHYKRFASGISASGRNLILSLSSKF